ncbi:MAG: ATP-binding cassette domain-containing protein [Bryobacteraceae bacterium]|nr:ATP-binding cassette domain-containing protein [Bryobacteraceae bacterium]
MIEVEQLHKQFGEVVAVRGLSFKAFNGAITGLLGLNGAGKTTTLRIISGVLKPQRGSIRIDGVSAVESPSDAQEKTGALLDHTGLYSRLTARENLAYFGRLRRIPPPKLKVRIEELLSILGLESVADRPTAGFSQGERMKTALARAIIHSPGNLLLDEPTSGLDVITVRALRNFLKQGRDSGQCIVFSSHILEEVRALSDNIVIVAKGAVIADGTPEAVCRKAGTASLEEAFVRLTATQEAAAC